VDQYASLWQRAASHDALFSPSTGDFLRSLKSAKTFYFEFSPYEHEARVVSFHVAGLPQSMYDACVTAEIDQAESRAKEAAAERVCLAAEEKRQREEDEKRRVRLAAEEKQQREENEKRLADLRSKCAPFANGSVDSVERSESPLPPKDCWEVLSWMHSVVNYDELVKRRELCALPSFAKDPAFCGTRPGSAPTAKISSADQSDQKLINQCLRDPSEKASLKDNCSHKWFADMHPRACEWANAQTAK
jgi:hypothetical protein